MSWLPSSHSTLLMSSRLAIVRHVCRLSSIGCLPSTVQGFYLADAAAFLTVIYRFVKAVGAFGVHHGFQSRIIRIVSMNRLAVDLHGAVPNIVCFGEQPAGFQRKNFNGMLLVNIMCVSPGLPSQNW
jgi:hypothetical protein